MSVKLDQLISQVSDLYNNSSRDFARWGFDHHVQVVAKWAEQIARQQKANVDLCVAAAYLHDVADVWLNDRPENHEQETLNKARELMQKIGFSQENINSMLVDILPFHSCHEDGMPKILDAKVLATADSLAHFDSDFYLGFVWHHWNKDNLDDFKKWLLKKIDRDFQVKIFWPEYQEMVRDKYQALKIVFAI